MEVKSNVLYAEEPVFVVTAQVKKLDDNSYSKVS
jgi:hypothetical protein